MLNQVQHDLTNKKNKTMKTKLICKSLITASLFAIISCSSNGNTGNGSMDTGIKVGSGYSDSLDPEKGTYDTTTTPDDSKKDYDQRQ